MKANAKLALLAGAVLLAATARAAEVLQSVERQPLNVVAVAMFVLFVLATLGITYWAAARTRSLDDFYTAGGGITGFQNGLALAGDYMSAAALLGVTGTIFASGYDGFIYAISFFVAWPLLLFLFAEKIRNLGSVTIADIASYRLDQDSIRTLMSFGSLTFLPRGADGRRRPADPAAVRARLQLRRDLRRLADDCLCDVWRHGSHHLGADHQGGPAAGGRNPARPPGALEVPLLL